MVRTLDADRHAGPQRKTAGIRDGRNLRKRTSGGNVRHLRKGHYAGSDTDNEYSTQSSEEKGSNRHLNKAYMSFRTVAAMLILLAIMTGSLIYYIRIQAEVTRTTNELADMEQELAQKRAENDAEYNEINDRISLDEIREKAIHELGMKYADRDQVVIYSGSEEDTVKKVGESEK